MISVEGTPVDEDNKLVEKYISVRLSPYIYAFTTNTIPTYLKVGDTLRGVDTRIDEWRKIISENLKQDDIEVTERYRHPALLSNEIYFRDYAVHKYLKSIGKKAIEEPLRSYYSQEFFADTTVEDVKNAIQTIKDDFSSENTSKIYDYYKVVDNKSATFHGNNDKNWKLRPNQKAVVRNFLAKKDKHELLMYAVMRFGKSFTAMSCALAVKARKVLIVSAKADVVGEWQKTVETPKCFKGFKFLTDRDLASGTKISDVLKESKDRKVAIFLTLQNLTGKLEKREDNKLKVKPKNIKDRLLQVFNEKFDLIIVDETHYGAWASTLGGPLKDEDADGDVIRKEQKEYANFKERVTHLKTKIKLHLSGTPYNLLYDNKFNDDNIVATCQFKDILRDKEKWDRDNFRKIENGDKNPDTGYPYQEFDNPYFGFPQMLRFAFNLPEETRKRLEATQKDWTLNDLFKTTVKGNNVKFIHESDVLRLLKAIDGSEKVDGILGFLDISKIKDNDVCKHMVFVLPRKYACDAMENLLNERKSEFRNLCNYKVLNITGHNLKPCLDTVEKVKAKIEECESKKEKTITLTVYKMLTGVTVKEWDTMFMLKDTHSAQEYDQAIFRIQNQYVGEGFVQNKDGKSLTKNKPAFKIDKKPQTILVDFDPIRMFTFQGLSSRITDNIKKGKQSLEESIKEELDFFPIITYNADKLVKVEPTDLIQLITQYNNNKSIIDSVQSVEFDRGLLNQQEILKYIEAQSSITTKNKLDTQAHSGEQTSDVQLPDDDGKIKTDEGNAKDQTTDNKLDKDLEKKYRMCIARLCFYSFLTHTNIDGINDIINSLDIKCKDYKDNVRIFNNLELNLPFIQGLKEHLSRYFVINVDDALKRANILSHDEDLTPHERAINALKNFNRFSDSEIVTPNDICIDMVEAIGKDALAEILNNGDKILDIASKSGEFAFAIYNLLHGHVGEEKIKNGIYSIPTSKTAYEFTRRIYETLGLNVDNIAEPNNLTAYDLPKITKTEKKKTVIDYVQIKKILTQNKPFSSVRKDDVVLKEEQKMIKFDVVVGNPPYQGFYHSQIYPFFYLTSINLSNKFVSLIFPTGWQEPKDANNLSKLNNSNVKNDKQIVFIDNRQNVFIGIPGAEWTNIILWEKGYDNGLNGKQKVYTNGANAKVVELLSSKGDVPKPPEIVKLDKIVENTPNFESVDKITSGRKPFPRQKSEILNISEKNTGDDFRIFNYDGCKFVTRNQLYKFKEASKKLINSYKVFIPYAWGNWSINYLGGAYADIFVAKPGDLCDDDTFLVVGPFSSEKSAMYHAKYLMTKFARALLFVNKFSRHTTTAWHALPKQNFKEKWWNLSISEINEKLFDKYRVPKNIRNFVNLNIQTKDESNIINYDRK